MDFTELTNMLDSLQGRFEIPGCECIVTLDGVQVYRHGAGWADAAHSKPVSAQDVYYMFSATKLVTCTAVLQLVEHGALRLEDRLDRYLPEFRSMRVLRQTPELPAAAIPQNAATRPAQVPIRIIDLLTMSAGLSYDLATPELRAAQAAGESTTRGLVRAIAASPLLYEPGTRWAYSLAHDVLAAVVEVVSGKRFSEYLRGALFDPLEMQCAGFAMTPELRTRAAALYAKDAVTGITSAVPLANKYLLGAQYESGGAGLIASADSYMRLVAALSRGGLGVNGARILKEKTVASMLPNRLSKQQTADFMRSGARMNYMGYTGYGYGLGVRTHLGPEGPDGEFGWDGAAGAYVLMNVRSRVGILYVQHVLSCMDAYRTVHPAIRELVYRALR